MATEAPRKMIEVSLSEDEDDEPPALDAATSSGGQRCSNHDQACEGPPRESGEKEAPIVRRAPRVGGSEDDRRERKREREDDDGFRQQERREEHSDSHRRTQKLQARSRSRDRGTDRNRRREDEERHENERQRKREEEEVRRRAKEEDERKAARKREEEDRRRRKDEERKVEDDRRRKKEEEARRREDEHKHRREREEEQLRKQKNDERRKQAADLVRPSKTSKVTTARHPEDVVSHRARGDKKRPDYRSLLTKIYELHAKEKIPDIDAILSNFVGQEAEMYERICMKYSVKVGLPPAARETKASQRPRPSSTPENLAGGKKDPAPDATRKDSVAGEHSKKREEKALRSRFNTLAKGFKDAAKAKTDSSRAHVQKPSQRHSGDEGASLEERFAKLKRN